MSLFDTIKNVIFHNPLAPKAGGESSTGHATRPAQPASSGRPAAPAATAAPAQAPRPAQPASTAPSQPVDVEAVLEALNAKSAQKLNWQTSIVDLMKLVGLDSSLQHRKELATELGYTGDQNDSAAMNIWLHKAVMRKLAENGGRVPSSLQ
jgi:3-oxoacyl-ACP reductase-like protein